MDAHRAVAMDLLRESWAPLDTLLEAHTAVLSTAQICQIVQARELLADVLVELSDEDEGGQYRARQ